METLGFQPQRGNVHRNEAGLISDNPVGQYARISHNQRKPDIQLFIEITWN